MADKLILKKDEKTLVKVIRIEECVKTVNFKGTNGGTWCRHDITAKDAQGREGKFEYLTQSKTPEGIVVGVSQWIKCTREDDIVATIEPTEPPEAPGSGRTLSGEKSGSHEPVQVNNASGHPMTFAMAYAKDILIAEISVRADKAVTEDDMDRLCKWAGIIHDEMVHKMQPK